jgi:hypothetical protein
MAVGGFSEQKRQRNQQTDLNQQMQAVREHRRQRNNFGGCRHAFNEAGAIDQ